MINHDSQSAIERLDANVFDREALQYTIRLIRNQNPSLALHIQNIIAPAVSDDGTVSTPPEATDMFVLELDSYTLKRIVETLGVVGQELAEEVLRTQQGDHDKLLATKEVIGQWLRYAKHFQAESENAGCTSSVRVSS